MTAAPAVTPTVLDTTVSPAALPSFASAAAAPTTPPPTDGIGLSVVVSIADALTSSPSAGRDGQPDQHVRRRDWTVDDADGELQTTLQRHGCDVIYRILLEGQTSGVDKFFPPSAAAFRGAALFCVEQPHQHGHAHGGSNDKKAATTTRGLHVPQPPQHMEPTISMRGAADSGQPRQHDSVVPLFRRTKLAGHKAVIFFPGPGMVQLRAHTYDTRCPAHDDAANRNDVGLCTEDPRDTCGDSTRVSITVSYAAWVTTTTFTVTYKVATAVTSISPSTDILAAFASDTAVADSKLSITSFTSFRQHPATCRRERRRVAGRPSHRPTDRRRTLCGGGLPYGRAQEARQRRRRSR